MQGLARHQYLSDLLEPYSPLRSLRSALKLLLNSPSFTVQRKDINHIRFAHQDFGVCQLFAQNQAHLLTFLRKDERHMFLHYFQLISAIP